MLPAPSDPRSIDPSRRQFIQGASALVAGGVILGANAQLARSAFVSGTDEIKIGLIGCGGRGRGAALQALGTTGKVTLWAMADAFQDRVDDSLNYLKTQVEEGKGQKNHRFDESTIDVSKDRQFVGFDAYQKVIDSGVDVVILATTPGFRPIHYEAAVNAGKNIFSEKPVAVDAAGIRRFLAANDEAKKKGLKVGIGLQRHHDPRYIETIDQLKNGAIGDVEFTRVYWNGNTPWVKVREPNMTEMEYQMRNWYFFVWLCGDHIVEQHIHNIDVSNWLLGAHPVEAQGMGGRQLRSAKEGQIYDHHCVEFTYANGTKMFSQCRHMDRVDTNISEHAHGTKGSSEMSKSLIRTAGADDWTSKAKKVDPYQQEHDDLFAAIRKGETYNEGDNGAHSTMTAILGRMATYSGKTVKWDDAMASTHNMWAKSYDFKADPPVMPDADGHYPIPTPGKMDPMQA
jgi:myo-inositol 2-dehydrogenase/D-chiro-inositol 1-dehydrogenase